MFNPTRKGVCKIKQAGGLVDVKVEDSSGNGMTSVLTESDYLKRGYGPALEELPWCNEMSASKVEEDYGDDEDKDEES